MTARKFTRPLSREEVREIFLDHRGVPKQIADALGKRHSTLSAWLAGGPNRKLDKLIPDAASRLRAGEPVDSILDSIRAEVSA